MIASAPACAAILASAMVVPSANQAMPQPLRLLTNRGGKTPIIDETAAGLRSKNVSHCSLKSGSAASPDDSGTPGPHLSKNCLIFSSASPDRLGLGSGTHTFSWNGPELLD